MLHTDRMIDGRTDSRTDGAESNIHFCCGFVSLVVASVIYTEIHYLNFNIGCMSIVYVKNDFIMKSSTTIEIIIQTVVEFQ